MELRPLIGYLFYLTTELVLSVSVSNRVRLRIKSSPDSGSIREGDTVTVSCDISGGKSPFDVVHIVRQIKGQEYQITTNDFLKDTYKNTGRYRIGRWEEDGTIELVINNIRGEDGGNIGCRHFPSAESSFKDLIVDVPPSGVELLYQTLDGQWFLASADEKVQIEMGISCRARVIGSDFEPDVQILIDGTDVTSRFVKAPVTKVDEDNNGFVNVGTWTEYSANVTSAMTDHAYLGKKLTCQVTMPRYPPKVASLVIDVTSKPHLKCANKFLGKLGDANVAISCQGKMTPGPSNVAWRWGSGKGIELVPDKLKDPTTQHRHSDGKNSVVHKVLGNNEHQFQLLFTKLMPDDFRQYSLHVSNGIGTSAAYIQLEEPVSLINDQQFSPDNDDSSAVFVVPSNSQSLGSRSHSWFSVHPLLLFPMLFGALLTL